MGKPESCLNAEQDGLHGEKFVGKRGKREPWLPEKVVI
jgi:hypothetical protein